MKIHVFLQNHKRLLTTVVLDRAASAASEGFSRLKDRSRLDLGSLW